MRDRRSRRGSISVVLALGAPWLLGSCDFILGSEPEPPSQVEIEVEAEATAPLMVVLSKDFQIVWDPEDGHSEALMLLSDTTTLEPAELPFTATVDFAPENRLLARVVNPSLDTALVRLIIRLDGSLAHDQSIRISDFQYIEYTTTY